MHNTDKGVLGVKTNHKLVMATKIYLVLINMSSVPWYQFLFGYIFEAPCDVLVC